MANSRDDEQRNVDSDSEALAKIRGVQESLEAKEKEPLNAHRQSCYLFGRERRVGDIPIDHPSCSKQHSVLQYRQVEEEENPDGTVSRRVRPYLMDLESTNGTFINDEPMEPHRYYELFEKGTIKFGNSR